MRALTLTQPWAGLVATGIKLVENRPRSMIKREDFGKPFAIHASREIDERVYARIYEVAPEMRDSRGGYGSERWLRFSRITSAVIAVATIDRVIQTASGLRRTQDIIDLGEAQERWFFGPIGYVLRDVIALPTPVTCRGFQGFWTLPADVEVKVRAQL